MATGDYTSSKSVESLKKLFRWPKGKFRTPHTTNIRSQSFTYIFFAENLFPVLDIVRLAVRDQATCSTLLTPDILAVIVGSITDSPANKLMSIRCLANMLQHGYGRGLIETCLSNVLIGINGTKQGSGNLQVCILI